MARFVLDRNSGDSIGKLDRRLRAIPAVVDVHDLHIWTLTSEIEVVTVHLMTHDGADPHLVLDQVRTILEEVGITHTMLQVEPDPHQGCAEISW